MLRSAFSIKSLERYFLILAVGVLVPVSVLTGLLLIQSWKTYTATGEALRGFIVVRNTVKTMESLSAERGPMNAALGLPHPVPESSLTALETARAASDTRIAELLALYRAPVNPNGAEGFTAVQHIRYALMAARENADRLIITPRESLSGYSLMQAVDRMVELVPELQASMADSVGAVTQNETDAPSLLTLALLAAELREQAGLLGSTFTPALSKHRQLTDSDQFRIERVLGRIEGLRALINTRIATRSDLKASAVYANMDRIFFGDGLRFIDEVRDVAALAQEGTSVSTQQLASTYVPMMLSITQFRDEMLRQLEERILLHRQEAIRLLLITLIATTMLVAALMVSLGQFRRRVIRPFVQATRIIGAIADDTVPSSPIPVGKYQGEVDGMFSALRVLKKNAETKRRLEAERDRLIVDLATMAQTDFLTGLLNRRAFEAALDDARTHWRGTPAVMAFILFDIDHFKHINDTYGHAVGDEALKMIAALCRQTWRDSDIVARVGGEEFAVLCCIHQPSQAIDLAQRMRAGIESACLTADTGVAVTLTASFGVAYVSWKDAQASDRLFRHADELLYQAKMEGRNRVCHGVVNADLFSVY